MRLSAFAIERWRLTLIACLLVAAVGLYAFRTIPRSVDPHYPVPTVVVVASQPGADATDMEQTVARPIEDVVQGLDDIREVRSRSVEGVSYITVDFEFSTDTDARYNDVVREVTALRGRLPAGVADIEFRKVRTTEAVLLQLAIVGPDASPRRMEKYAEDLRDRLNVVPGVRQTRVYGVQRPQVAVAIDGGRLAQLGIPVTRLVDALRAEGLELPAGTVEAGGRRYNLEAGGAFRSLDEVRNTAIRAADGRVLRVRDVAAVGWAVAEPRHLTRLNGQRAVFVTVKQKDGANALAIRDGVERVLDSFRASLPPDMRLAIGFDQTLDIRAKLHRLGTDFAIALVLVLLTLLPLGGRAALIVAISIPLSLAVALAVLGVLGFTLNQMAVAGFIISLGLLVDDSIVVTENIARYLRQGLDRREAALAATREIAAPVLGCTGVLMLAFLPLMFLPDAAGRFTRPMQLAVLLSVGASLLVSLTAIPFLASRLLPRTVDPHGNRLLRAIDGGIAHAYAPLLRRALDRPRATVAAAMLACVAVLALVPTLGFRLFPVADVPYFLVQVETPEGTGVDATGAAVAFVSRVLAREPRVVARLENAGRGNPQVFYNVREDYERANFGAVLVTLDRWRSDEGPALLERLRRRFDAYPHARIVVRAFENGVPVEAPVGVRVSGPDLAQLKRIAARIEAVVRETPGTRDVVNPVAVDRTELSLGVEADRAAALGVQPGAARRLTRLAIAGEATGRLRDEEGDSYDVVVRLPRGEHQTLAALDEVYVPAGEDGVVPLRQIARPRMVRVPPEVSRYKLQRTVTVTAQVAAGHLASAVNRDVAERVRRLPLPNGYAVSLGGEAEASARSTGGLGLIATVALFGILAVLVLEFGGFREVLAVAGVIPLGLVGGVAALFVTGQPLSYMAVIGFIALIGIEIKNSILLVDLTARLRGEGMPLRAAVERAGEVRFLPVLLTSVTAACGLLPLALSGLALYISLAIVIIGGLISSTLLSRVVVPALYLVVARRAGAASPA